MANLKTRRQARNRRSSSKTSNRKDRRRQQQRVGAAAVEFAVVAPLMIMLTLGMMEIGRVVMVKQLLVNATREGARLAVLPGVTAQEVQDEVQVSLDDASLSGTTITVSPAVLSTASAGTPVTVTVSMPASAASWIPNPVYTVNTTLESSTTMRKESQ